ncbi:DUF484 family protein [Snodgrassella sp. CFCC 13594]|uniref:DUF484 family protein n=1 Tax=Snodgrassella sp. CFCC 13594 TaxID=1775559 RepID=UPI000833DA55|nr:DUF484 family protein [Snodgrassella sp. CFCC 13594]
MAISEQTILHYLQAHPDFLPKHAEALGIRLPESKILSFQQGSLQALKLKTEKMAQQLSVMLANAEENQATTAKLLSFNRHLLAVNTVNQCIDTVMLSLAEDFHLPHAGLFISMAVEKVRVKAAYDVHSQKAVMQAVNKLKEPLCGTHIAPALLALLPQQAALESFLQLPVVWMDHTIAVLLIGHEDATYFHEALATDFVESMADSLSVVLARLLRLPAA